jgi:hypothetical protein
VPFYWLVLGVLTVWRVTHLLIAENGPWDVLVRLRRLTGHGFWGSLLGCFYCLSLWVAAPLAYGIGGGWMERVLLWLSLSAAAILLERITASQDASLPVTYSEDEEGEDVLR